MGAHPIVREIGRWRNGAFLSCGLIHFFQEVIIKCVSGGARSPLRAASRAVSRAVLSMYRDLHSYLSYFDLNSHFDLYGCLGVPHDLGVAPHGCRANVPLVLGLVVARRVYLSTARQRNFSVHQAAR